MEKNIENKKITILMIQNSYLDRAIDIKDKNTRICRRKNKTPRSRRCLSKRIGYENMNKQEKEVLCWNVQLDKGE